MNFKASGKHNHSCKTTVLSQLGFCWLCDQVWPLSSEVTSFQTGNAIGPKLHFAPDDLMIVERKMILSKERLTV